MAEALEKCRSGNCKDGYVTFTAVCESPMTGRFAATFKRCLCRLQRMILLAYGVPISKKTEARILG